MLKPLSILALTLFISQIPIDAKAADVEFLEAEQAFAQAEIPSLAFIKKHSTNTCVLIKRSGIVSTTTVNFIDLGNGIFHDESATILGSRLVTYNSLYYTYKKATGLRSSSKLISYSPSLGRTESVAMVEFRQDGDAFIGRTQSKRFASNKIGTDSYYRCK